MYRVHNRLGSDFVRKVLHQRERKVYERIQDYYRAHQNKNTNIVHFISKWSIANWGSIECLIFPFFVSVRQDMRHAEGAHIKGHTVSLCNQLSKAVHFLHTQLKVAHMDIKPDNLVLDVVEESYGSHPTLKIIDFDISILDSAHTLTSGTRGTPGYMAPEVETGDSYIPFYADRYSCGRTMKELLDMESSYWANRNLYKAFMRFAAKLCAENPAYRPSLLSRPRPPLLPPRSLLLHYRPCIMTSSLPSTTSSSPSITPR